MPIKTDTEVVASPEQSLLQQADDDVVAETLSQQLEHSDHVTINQEVIEAIYEKWHREYSPGGARHKDMISGLEKMQPWLADMKAAFRTNRLSEEFVYLAIAESHFQMFARSRSDARGPYQFMEKTARKRPADLVITVAYDERIDPIKSASACSRLLADNYRGFSNNNISHEIQYDKNDSALYLAVSGYNGTYPWQYARATPKKNRSINDYLAFVETRINSVIGTAIRKHAERKHAVRPKETLSAIAKRYATTPEALVQANSLQGTALKAGQKLRIPSSEKQRTAAIYGAFRNHNENLNYPAKLYAILDVIREFGLEQRFAAGKRFDFAEVPIKQTQHITLVHTVVPKDTLYSLVRTYAKGLGVTEAALRQTISAENKLGSSGALVVGQKITIGSSRQAPTLEKIARDNNVSIDILRTLNPAILSVQSPLSNLNIRIPKKSLLAERS